MSNEKKKDISSCVYAFPKNFNFQESEGLVIFQDKYSYSKCSEEEFKILEKHIREDEHTLKRLTNGAMYFGGVHTMVFLRWEEEGPEISMSILTNLASEMFMYSSAEEREDIKSTWCDSMHEHFKQYLTASRLGIVQLD
jgi:hypothetical protein